MKKISFFILSFLLLLPACQTVGDNAQNSLVSRTHITSLLNAVAFNANPNMHIDDALVEETERRVTEMVNMYQNHPREALLNQKLIWQCSSEGFTGGKLFDCFAEKVKKSDPDLIEFNGKLDGVAMEYYHFLIDNGYAIQTIPMTCK